MSFPQLCVKANRKGRGLVGGGCLNDLIANAYACVYGLLLLSGSLALAYFAIFTLPLKTLFTVSFRVSFSLCWCLLTLQNVSFDEFRCGVVEHGVFTAANDNDNDNHHDHEDISDSASASDVDTSDDEDEEEEEEGATNAHENAPNSNTNSECDSEFEYDEDEDTDGSLTDERLLAQEICDNLRADANGCVSLTELERSISLCVGHLLVDEDREKMVRAFMALEVVDSDSDSNSNSNSSSNSDATLNLNSSSSSNLKSGGGGVPLQNILAVLTEWMGGNPEGVGAVNEGGRKSPLPNANANANGNANGNGRSRSRSRSARKNGGGSVNSNGDATFTNDGDDEQVCMCVCVCTH